MKVGILTASDRGSRGEREDLSGPLIAEMIGEIGGTVVDSRVVPDERGLIAQNLRDMSDRGLDLILTTGGTGLGPRDVTPEATEDVIERKIPGFSEVMRAVSVKKTPHGMLSRGTAGVVGRTLIINLPGSPKAARECLEAILPAIPHAVEVLRSDVLDCGRSQE